MIVHDRICRLKEHLGLSQAEFGEKLGVSRSCVNNWTMGVNNIKADDIVNICKTFNVSSDWLLGLSDDNGWQYSDWYKPYRPKIHRRKSTKA